MQELHLYMTFHSSKVVVVHHTDLDTLLTGLVIYHTGLDALLIMCQFRSAVSSLPQPLYHASVAVDYDIY